MSTRTTARPRLRTTLTTLTMAGTALLLTAPAAQAADTTAPSAAHAGTFVATTLAAGGDHYVYPGGTYFDGGNTIDGVLALYATRVAGDQATASMGYLEANLGSYIGTDFGDTYAGPLAKVLLAVVAGGDDPTSFAGTNLVTTLEGLQADSGRLSDDSAYGDYSNSIGQSLGVIALTRAASPAAALSATYLASQQCADGGFSAMLDPDPCVSETDATGFAAQALLAAGLTDDAAEALDWLAKAQQADGSFISGDGAASTNSTGVAAQAFWAGGRTAQAELAVAFIGTLQYGCSATAALRGGIASTPGTINTAVEDSDLRATPQSALALAGGSLVSVTRTDSVAAPAWVCASPSASPSTSPSASASTTPSQSASAAPAATTQAPTRPAPSPPAPELANTGAAEAAPNALLGLSILLTGIALVAIGRPRYARRH